MIIQQNTSGSFMAFQLIHNRPVMADMPTRKEAMEECALLVQANHAGYLIGYMNARREWSKFHQFLKDTGRPHYPVGSIEEMGYLKAKAEIEKKEGVRSPAYIFTSALMQ